MLTAWNQYHQLITAKGAKAGQPYVCLGCHQPVILKRGQQKLAHFAHQQHQLCGASESESPEHLQGKWFLATDLRTIFPRVTLESYLHAIRQRADIRCDQVVFEYQCSPLSTQRLSERIYGYSQIQLVSFWILGNRYYQQRCTASSVQRFLRFRKTIGYYLVFLIEPQNQYRLRYQIQLHDHRLQFQERSFTSFQAVQHFWSKGHLQTKKPDSLSHVTKTVARRLQHGQSPYLELQLSCYQAGYNLLGCPLIVHWPRFQSPLMKPDWLGWRVRCLLLLQTRREIAVTTLYQRSCNLIRRRATYPCLHDVNNLIFAQFEVFLTALIRQRLVQRTPTGVILLKKIPWFSDTSGKLKEITKQEGK